MTEPIQYEKMEDSIIKIFQEQTDNADLPINDYLKNELKTLDSSDRMEVLDKLIDQFDSDNHIDEKYAAVAIDDHVLARVIKLLLGRDITKVDFNSNELLESLAESINTVFESLNQLISVINTTLVGKQGSDETIRQVIGYHLEGSSQTKTLESYIGQIGKAFFASQEASKKAAHAKVMQILEELSPEKIEKEAGVSRLSPMRKSKYYEVYELKFKKFEKWFESGRFMESFLREFERNCQKISF
ncbi:MAG: hypothetical protein K8S13_17490 [Desulfobacula sp.]|uniref:type VI secretion system-associated FHA domain protein n=1 Tax=Desulfobacula sp. TaxID=2593537 RepID=UPI0025C5DE5B|nr:type VI secretion system-associated FHA domain protein [Desulfobacula sp.]MCD4721634.1 hypothetical protein [Desulfobacula sp.]